MRKCLNSKSDFYLALMEWRNTQTEGMKSSPQQRAMGRQSRTLLPVNKEDLKIKSSMVEQDLKDIQRKKRDQKLHYNKNKKDLIPLK